jgi:hypothetical protein
MKTLAKYHDALFATVNGAGVITIDYSAVSSEWEQPNPGFLVSSQYFDLAGMSQEEKTLFIEASAVQEGGFPAINGVAGDNYVLIDIMTSIPVDWVNFGLPSSFVALRGLGFPGQLLNFEHVIYQRYRRFTLDIDTSARFAMVTNDNQSGSNMPTASDRIYCYRLVIVDTSQAPAVTVTSINVPPARYLLNVQAKEEPTYQHLMRLKRSYDLQQTPDVD